MALQFSSSPGCRERHLQRKVGNPLFPESERSVTQAQVDEARRLDAEEQRAFDEQFRALLEEASGLSGSVDTEVILEMKERLDRLYDQCAGLGGDHTREKQALQQFNQVLMAAIQGAAAGDPMAAQELEQEQSAREMHLKLLEYSLVPDLLRADSPIGAHELVPTLLSQDRETVQVVMSLFDEQQQEEIRTEARALVEDLAQRGESSQQLQQALSAIQAPLQ